jgi:hypothetical protein
MTMMVLQCKYIKKLNKLTERSQSGQAEIAIIFVSTPLNERHFILTF